MNNGDKVVIVSGQYKSKEGVFKGVSSPPHPRVPGVVWVTIEGEVHSFWASQIKTKNQLIIERLDEI